MVVAPVNGEINATQIVYEATETGEVDLHVMVDGYADEVANSLNEEPGAAVGIGGIDFIHPVARNINIKIAGQRKDGSGVVFGVDTNDEDGVRVSAFIIGTYDEISLRRGQSWEGVGGFDIELRQS